MQIHEHNIDTAALLDDLLDPSINAIAICKRHGFSLAQLTEFLEGPLFTGLTAAASALSQARTKLLALDIAPKALAALLATTKSDQESRQLNETIRKSATKLLSITAKSQQPVSSRSNATPTAQHPPTISEVEPHIEHAKPIPPKTKQPPATQRAKSDRKPTKRSPIATNHNHPLPSSTPSAAALRAIAGSPNATPATFNAHPP